MNVRFFAFLFFGFVSMTNSASAQRGEIICQLSDSTRVCIAPNRDKWKYEKTVEAFAGSNTFYKSLPDGQYELFIGNYSTSPQTTFGHKGDMALSSLNSSILGKIWMSAKYLFGASGWKTEKRNVVNDLIWSEVWETGHNEIYVDAFLYLRDSEFHISLEQITAPNETETRNFEVTEAIMKDLTLNIAVDETDLHSLIANKDVNR